MSSSPLPTTSKPPPLARQPRSIGVTLFSWGFIIAGVVLVPVSGFTMLALMVGGHGTQNANGIAAVVVVGAAPSLLTVGVGMLRRLRWACLSACVLLATVMVWNGATLQRGPTPERTTLSSSGVPTTVLASEVDVPLHLGLVIASVVMLGVLATARVRGEFGIRRFAYPRLTQPHSGSAARATMRSTSRAAARPSSFGATPAQLRALWLATGLLLAVGVGLASMAVSGLLHEQTYFPAKRPSHQRVVQRSAEPVIFWFSLGIYATLAAGALGLGSWGVREARALSRMG